MNGLALAVYFLCFVASLTCLALLARSYLRTRSRLLLWSTLCFVGLALNNLLILIDLFVVPQIDLMVLRSLTSLAAVCVLLYGFIWETD